MKTISTLAFLFFYTSINPLIINSNTVKGKITLPEFERSFIQKGANYQTNAAAVSTEKRRIDEMNHPSKNIYISLHPLDFEPELQPTKGVQMTQREKTFYPNIVAVTKGSTVQFVNEDEHYHNVYSLTQKSRFNIGRRPMGNVYGQKINKVGIIKLGCDIHEEMSATILSLDTPYFTKINEDGTYKISELPDGSYEIKIYHPSIKRYTDEITVQGGQVLEKDIKLQPKA